MRLVQSVPQDLEREDPIKVAIVDDSVVVRGLLSRWLIETPGISVVGTYRSGRDIINHVVNAAPDVVLLDIEMPDIDGLSALPHILKARPQAVVIVASTLTARNADISLKCIALGATDYLLKPQSNREVSTSQDFRHALIDKILTLGGRAKLRQRARPEPPPRVVRKDDGNTEARPVQPYAQIGPATLPPMRAPSRGMPKALLIGASTGGPQAVMALLKGIRPMLANVPVLIAQHMPAAFTTMFAEHLTRHAAIDVVQASHGEPVRPGRVFVAPGGRHMEVKQDGPHMVISISDAAPVNFCKPSVDVLFDSATELLGSGCLAVVLTGMGMDGAKGALRIAEAGGTVIAQDEATSVVWGMPGATVRLGACSAVMSVQQMVPALGRLLTGDRT
ncbi:MAG: chemotaxis response regulator protein-glutamate methylesterase [Beijerinckiaceae bacterium]|nr:chemotaxis response regulator protein-glutamate methylesterase [Beijerinckiaceae bacterium]